MKIPKDIFPLQINGEKLLIVPNSIPLEDIFEPLIQFACGFFGLTRQELFSKTRKREIVKVRQYCHYLCLSIHNNPTKVSLHLGGQDHATALHSKDVILELLETDKATKKEFLMFNNFFVKEFIKKFPFIEAAQEFITCMEIEIILTGKGKSIEEISEIKNKILDELLAKLYRHPDHVPPSLKDVLF